jgi:hypothetical protein
MRNVAVQVFGSGSIVRRNRIYDTGIHYTDGNAVAIMASGASYVLDNTVDAVVGAPGTDMSVYGIAVTGFASGSVVAGNRVRGLSEDGAGYATGILVPSDAVVSIRGNMVAYVPGSTGISCGSGVVIHDSVAASNHVTGGLGLAIDKCTDGGGNLTR